MTQGWATGTRAKERKTRVTSVLFSKLTRETWEVKTLEISVLFLVSQEEG